MWFYLGIFTTAIALIIRFHQKFSIQSALQNRPKDLIPASGQYKFNWIPATDKVPATGYIEIACETSLQFSARVEKEFDRFAKYVGLAYECQTGYETLDEKVYLSSITQEDADAIGQNTELSSLILECILGQSNPAENTSGNELICDGKQLYLKTIYQKNVAVAQTHFIENKRKLLQALAKQLQGLPAQSPHFWKVPTQRNTAIVLALSSAIAVVGGLEFVRFIILSDNDLFAPWALAPSAFLIGLFGGLLLILFVLIGIKPSARRHLILAEVCLFGFSGLTFASYGWLYDINQRWDTSPTEVRVAQVTDKYSVYHRRRRSSYHTYHLRIQPSAPPLEDSIKISNGLYNRVEIGQNIEISIKNGYLNHPWLENIERQKEADSF